MRQSTRRLASRYQFTRKSRSVPLSSFTLFFSDLTTEPSVLPAVESDKLAIPTTPWVCPVMGARAFEADCVSDGVLPPVDGEGLGIGADPPIPGFAFPPPAAVPPPLPVGADVG